ncbi:hypothetical protein, partial [Escherichia coli]|uniref:hypothetical protein n=1 Tax=Escherichia coli TaxID=562 RepID=UPI000CC064C6
FMEGQRQQARTPVVRIIDEPIGILSYMDARAMAALAQEPLLASGAFLSVDPKSQGALYRQLKTVPAIGSVSLREATLQS